MIPSRSGAAERRSNECANISVRVNFKPDGEGFVAVKIVHTTRSQEVRFGDRATAEHYAAQYGGLDAWRVLPVPGGRCQTGSRESYHR